MSTHTVTRQVCNWCGKKSRPMKHFTQNGGQHDYPKGWTWAHLQPNSPFLMDWCSADCKKAWEAKYTIDQTYARGRGYLLNEAFNEDYIKPYAAREQSQAARPARAQLPEG